MGRYVGNEDEILIFLCIRQENLCLAVGFSRDTSLLSVSLTSGRKQSHYSLAIKSKLTDTCLESQHKTVTSERALLPTE
jgi:hypothetical protein